MICNVCEHECHCYNGGSCRTQDCECKICEHNPLDEFYRTQGDVKQSKEINKIINRNKKNQK